MAINPAEITTIRIGELPLGTIDLTSKIAVENGTDLQQVTGQELVDFVNTNANAFQFEIKDMWVTQAYIDTNFTGNGLGQLIMTGWAICNGFNGTPNLNGLVSVGYGVSYPVIGGFGGSKDSVVVSHTHTFDGTAGSDTGVGTQRFATGTQNEAGGSFGISTSGVDGTNKNMQPYIILLKIMKL